MKIEQIDVNLIKRDINQPRQAFDPAHVKEMAQSIKTTGIINPIELDKGYVIITGEIRWRASKIAGLKTVPCKILTITKDDRFVRQVIENIHHNTMSDWDTAKAMKKMLSLSSPNKHPKSPKSGITEDKGISWLSLKLGKSRHYIQSHLELLKSSKSVQKAIQNKKITRSLIDELQYTPKEHKKELEKRLVKGEFNKSGSRTIRKIGQVITQFPEKSNKILEQDYSKDTMEVAGNKIQKIVPEFTTTPMADAFSETLSAPNQLGKLTVELLKWLKANPKDTVSTNQIKRVATNLVFVKESIILWLQDEEILKLPPHEVIE